MVTVKPRHFPAKKGVKMYLGRFPPPPLFLACTKLLPRYLVFIRNLSLFLRPYQCFTWSIMMMMMLHIMTILHALSYGNASCECAADTLHNWVIWGGFWLRKRGLSPGNAPPGRA